MSANRTIGAAWRWGGSLAVAGTLLLVGALPAASPWGLEPGTAELQSAGPLAFGPDGILLVGDAKGATVFAIDTEDGEGDPGKVRIEVVGLDQKVAELLGASGDEVRIQDMAVNPLSGNAYFSVAVGPEDQARPAIVRVDAAGELSQIDLEKVSHSKMALPDAPEDRLITTGRRPQNPRLESITDLAYSEGRVLVAGLSRADAPSTVRELSFPFSASSIGTSLEIYHAAHGRTEDYAAVRAFVPLNIDGEPSLLAGFTCTPLVSLPLSSLEPGAKVRGTTVAELGNRNRPLDMIVYRKDGRDYVLMANSARGVMKISTENLAEAQGLTEPVRGGGTAGQPHEVVESLQGVVQLDRLNDTHALVVVQRENGSQDLLTVELP